jgi:hypothetical protein
MATNLHMIEEWLETGHGMFLFMGRIEVSDEEPEFSVFYEIRSERKNELALEIRFVATNPIGIDDIIIGTATTYGLCIASQLTRKTAKEAIKCYKQSKSTDPDRGVLHHAKAAARCLAAKGATMKETATDALVDCWKIRDNDDSDG